MDIELSGQCGRTIWTRLVIDNDVSNLIVEKRAWLREIDRESFTIALKTRNFVFGRTAIRKESLGYMH